MIVEAERVGDFGDGVTGGAEELAGSQDAQPHHVAAGGGLVGLAELALELSHRKVGLRGHIRDGDVSRVFAVEEVGDLLERGVLVDLVTAHQTTQTGYLSATIKERDLVGGVPFRMAQFVGEELDQIADRLAGFDQAAVVLGKLLGHLRRKEIVVGFSNEFFFRRETTVMHEGAVATHQAEIGVLGEIHQVWKILEELTDRPGTQGLGPFADLLACHVAIIHKKGESLQDRWWRGE